MAEAEQLVPHAERPFVSYDELETVQETVWYNPTDKDILIEVHVGTRPVYTEQQQQQFRSVRERNPGQYRELRTGRRIYKIEARSRRAISCDFDQAIQQTECLEPDCTTQRLYCQNRKHRRRVMGGGYPMLINESVQHRPIVHSALIPENAAREEAAKKVLEAMQAKQASDQALMLAAAKQAEADAMAATVNGNTAPPGNGQQTLTSSQDPSKGPQQNHKKDR